MSKNTISGEATALRSCGCNFFGASRQRRGWAGCGRAVYPVYAVRSRLGDLGERREFPSGVWSGAENILQ